MVFALDRAGPVGQDGPTHNGVFDIAYLRTLPNMTLCAPRDETDMRRMLATALTLEGPCALRFPRGPGVGVPLDPEIKALPIGEAELLRVGSSGDCNAEVLVRGVGTQTVLLVHELGERAPGQRVTVQAGEVLEVEKQIFEVRLANLDVIEVHDLG